MLGVSGSRARPRVYAGKSITSVVQQLGKKALKLSAITKTETREIAGGFSCGERRPEAREIAHGSNVCRRVKRLHALIVSSKWNKNHGASRLLSHHHLRRPNGKMKLPKFLRIPKFHRRTRSKAGARLVLSKAKAKPTWLYHVPQNQLQIFGLAPQLSRCPVPWSLVIGNQTVCKQIHSRNLT